MLHADQLHRITVKAINSKQDAMWTLLSYKLEMSALEGNLFYIATMGEDFHESFKERLETLGYRVKLYHKDLELEQWKIDWT